MIDQQGLINLLQDQVDLLREQVLVLQHGVGNPIVIEDLGGETDSDSSSEGIEVSDDDDDVVMYCQGHSCPSSNHAALYSMGVPH